MGVGFRHYLFVDDAEPVRLSERVVVGLVHGRDALPQFAGTSQKILMVVLDVDGQKVNELVRAEGSVWLFDEGGDITKGSRESFSLVLDQMTIGSQKTDNVISIQPEISKKKLQEKFRWEPSNAEIDRITRDLWPTTRADSIKFVQGVSKRQKTLTWDARQFIEEFDKSISMVNYKLSNLKIPALKSLVDETGRRAKEDPDYKQLYRAVREMAENRLTIEQQRQRNKGTWYAAVDVMRFKENIYETILRFHERCKSRDAAEKAAQRLLAEHANQFRADVTIEAHLYTEREWEWEDQFGPASQSA